ncbi:hypothetical protein [Mailhella sp.]|uniref:hypothetical protein n=1 Tax=Mailhella sp. TaxID=1981029 RepID=UPI00406397A5
MDKKNVLRFFLHCACMAAVPALLAVGYVGLAYVRDPLHLFHAPKGELYLNSQMRMQAAGIINSFEFDSIILGTSILENSSSADMKKTLGGNFVNISLSGSNYWERAIVLKYAIKKKTLKRVVYSLDRNYQHCPEKSSYAVKNWNYLYNNSRLDDFKLYFTNPYFKNILHNIPMGRKRTLDKPNEWMSNRYHSCRFGGLHNWLGNMDKQGMGDFLRKRLPKTAAKADPNAPLVRNPAKEKRAATYVDKYVLSFAEQHPETEFYLVFPPYWRFDSAEMRQTNPAAFALHQQTVRHTVRRAEALGNVRVFGFDDCAFVDDIARYKDVTHYDDGVNAYIAESMGQNRHRLTSANMEEYLARCEELARAFDIKALNREVQQRLSLRKK